MNGITRWDPLREVAVMSDRMNQLFDQLSGRSGRLSDEGSISAAWMPAVDIRETKDSLMLTVELAGIDPKDVQISVENNILSIGGERTFEQADEGETYHRVERAYGSFERTFRLPPSFRGEDIVAKAANGVLTLTVPKREEAKPRSIKVDIQNA
jgi:HSP20 family protein